MSDREKLPERHPSISTKVTWITATSTEHHLEVTFGFDSTRHVREIFCASFKASADIVALANDAMVVVSRCLQRGDTVRELARAMSENRAEGAASGPPASMVGAILREATRVEDEMLVGGEGS